MYTVHDISRVTEVYESHRARPISEVMRDFYPDATIDSHGRPHAPHDGYVDPLTDQTFRAGEFLPIEDYMREERSSQLRSRRPHFAQFIHEGEEKVLYGTPAQILHTKEEIRRQHYAALVGTSHHVGTVGERRELTLRIETRWQETGVYGEAYTFGMVDEEGNILRYRGSVDLGRPNDKIVVTATIKRHTVYRDVEQTEINRPSVSRGR